MLNSFVQHIKHDSPASIVVFFVVVPLYLGIALASGTPAMSGLIAGIVGGIVVGSLSESSFGVSGPAAGLVVIVFVDRTPGKLSGILDCGGNCWRSSDYSSCTQSRDRRLLFSVCGD